MFLALFVGILLARGLGAEGYGQYGIAMAVIGLASVPAEFGLPKLVTREMAAGVAQGEPGKTFGILRWSETACYAMSTVMAVAIFLGTFAMNRGATSPVALAILFGLPIIPLAALARIRGAALQGLRYVVLGQIPTIVIRPLLFSLLLFLLFRFEPGAGAAEVMGLQVAAAAVALAVAVYWLSSRLPNREPAIAVIETRRWLASAIVLGLANGMAILQAQITVLILGALATNGEVGLFRVGISTVVMVATPIALVATIVSPMLASMYVLGDVRRLQKLSTISARVQFAGVLMLALPIFIAGAEFISFVFGPEYEQAAAALQILCVGQLANSVFGLNATMLKMTHNEHRLTRALALGLAANACLAAVLIPSMGIVGAAWAYTASTAIWNAIAWRDVRSSVGINTLLR